MQALRNCYTAILPLKVLQDTDEYPRNSERGSIQRVRIPHASATLRCHSGFVPNKQAAGLEISAVGGGGYLTIAFDARHPCLDVILAVRRSTQVAAGHVQHLHGKDIDVSC